MWFENNSFKDPTIKNIGSDENSHVVDRWTARNLRYYFSKQKIYTTIQYMYLTTRFGKVRN